jgi:O-acetyl-ADP-ribose deacetylase
MTKIIIKQGDLAKERVDCIVNTVRTNLDKNGLLNGLIHQLAGPKLIEELKIISHCDIGQAIITKAYNLPCKYIIHTAGPMWQGGDKDEIKKLELCYLNSLELAKQNKIKTIALPAISTGHSYKFTHDIVAKVAIGIINRYLNYFDEVKIVLYEDWLVDIYQRENK